MHVTVKNLIKIKENINIRLSKNSNNKKLINIIAVSKTFGIDHIKPLIEYGHTDYGENKVQEAQEKWSYIKEKNEKIKLHLIGRLQTNKVKVAVKLFDFIHSLDSKKLADKISIQQKEHNLKVKLFIQVNIGEEKQKSGILKNEVYDFYQYCKSLDLNILGLMCIPPFNQNSSKYFSEMSNLGKKLQLKELSMGMSNDYIYAIENNSTYIRVGSNIFGERN